MKVNSTLYALRSTLYALRSTLKQRLACLLLCLSFMSNAAFSQTTLSPGDLVIVEFQTFNPDEFSFVPLVNLQAGTAIKFTDCGWKTNNTFRDGEAIMKWTATSSVTAGTVISCVLAAETATTGTLVNVTNIDGVTTSSIGYSDANGDQLIAYQTLGTNLYAVYTKNATPVNVVGSWDADATTLNTSASPTSNSIVKNGDNLVFTGTVTGNKAAILAAVNNPANWTATDGAVVTYTGSISFSVLPIELTQFDVQNTEGSKNHLTWRTESEKNNSHFDIERSTDGTTFHNIGQVKGNNKPSSYQFVDNQPFATTYYRLRQMDFDGTETYSKIVSVVQTGKGKGLTVYPNPVSSLLNIEYTEGSDFQVLNLLGQQVLTGKTGQRLDVSALPQGTYFLKVGAEQEKFMKQ